MATTSGVPQHRVNGLMSVKLIVIWFIIFNATALGGCNKNGQQASDDTAQICTPLMPQTYLDHLKYVTAPLLYPKPRGDVQINETGKFDNSDSWSQLLADCEIVKSRQYSDRSDEASSVVIAILEACKPTLENLVSRVRDEQCDPYGTETLRECEDNRKMDDIQIENLQKQSDEAEIRLRSAAQRAAIQYVIEARSGRCNLNRMKSGAPAYTGFPRIQWQ